MTREEFIGILQRTLAGSLSSGLVAENVRYYQEYMDTQIRSGRSEEEVLSELGDPRLLAKTIIEAGKYEGRGAQTGDSVYESGDAQGDGEQSAGGRPYRIPGWLFLVIIGLVLIVIVGAAFSILSALLPILIPVMVVVMIFRLIQRRG